MTKAEDFKPGNRKYTFALGRRKSAIAQVRLYAKGSGKIFINGLPIEEYLTTELLRQSALLPLELTNTADVFDATIVVKGGGKPGQSDAIKLALARAIVEVDDGYKTVVKKAGYLTRDARVKERKKYGLKKARRAPQWSKR